ncbi:ribulose-phosphate 3-epimerase [Spiroplasma chinense]|uniref:Ribulose-phosphate 3-epimerase n=1 Tax=Spiroplasma chinense TaxID=216932 RepID=A0A5B9Y511_9MOLU|nr:ribulose-phosphate 3-epimerase [Spiroplasma chinense]QEH62184.1 ribulose-phosphate 3-epimerase [Spiroplasma chinense]
MKKYIIAPSILTANFLCLEKDLKKLQDAGIEWIHYDVMDYNFVPNLSFGPKILADINSKFNFKMDAHLMVKINNLSVEEYLTPFKNARVDQITLHFEAISKEQFEEFESFCKKNNILISLAISPDTSVEEIKELLPRLDNVLVMSVYPGFGGQKFIQNSAEKIKLLKELKEKNNFKYRVEVDGGINKETFSIVKEAGVDMIVAGSYLVDEKITDLKERVEELEK